MIYPKLPKGDMRRVWVVLGAIESIDRATLTTLVDATGLPKASINDVLKKLLAGQVPGLVIAKQGAVYTVSDWGELLKKNGVKIYYNTACKVGLSDL